MGGFGTSMFGGTQQPYTPPPMMGQQNQQQFFQGLMGQTMQGGQIKGLPGYQGQLSPTQAQTPVQQMVNNAYSPTNAATNQLQQQLGSISQPNPQIQGAVNNLLNQGGPGGMPTQLMQQMATQGGTGGPGHNAMANLMQFGTPSANAGGMGLAESAQGYGPLMAMLQPYLAGAGKVPTAQGSFFTPPTTGGKH